MQAISPLYRLHEPGFRTQYAEVKERTRAAGGLLAGTPGTLAKRNGTGHGYWYRVYNPVPGKQAEEYVGLASDIDALEAMQARMEFADWMRAQVVSLRKLGFQVADKGVASVLVALHNQHIFASGMTMVGTLAYMAWLNEYGAVAVAARTQDIDLARRQKLKLAAALSFLATVQATKLPFVVVPGMPSHCPSTSVKLPGREGLRIDVLAPGIELGRIIRLPELEWHAQTVPYYDYLLSDPLDAALLAGGHCVPVRLPQPERMLWHKLYSCTQRKGEPEKAAKDLSQAITLAALLVEQDGVALGDSFKAVPPAMKAALRAAMPARMPQALRSLGRHPEPLAQFERLFKQ